jgi:hypothetical protein
MPSVRTCALVLASLAIFATSAHAARIEPWNKRCLRDQAAWVKKGKYKAVAVTKVYRGGQGCGHSWNWKTPALARKDALRKCNAILRRNVPGTKDRCVVILVR